MEMTVAPKVSVVMGVYNGEEFLRTAIESILDQTFEDFELLIVNDGSTDQTEQILNGLSDPRIRILDDGQNKGLTRRLIEGCNEARGKYIARMDADDISFPERFQKQIDFLEKNPDYAVVGTRCHFLDSKGKARRFGSHYCTDEEIKWDMCLRSPFVHGSTMLVREYLLACGGYREEFRYAQDYDLWLRIAETHKVANLPDILYGFRYHRLSITMQRLYLQSKFGEMAREFARMRALVGNDPISLGKLEEVQARIASWAPQGLRERMKIRSDSALQLLSFITPWAKLSDVASIWLGALLGNPLDKEVWKFPACEAFRSRMLTAIRNRLWSLRRQG
jgi:glycosyltransferase involved in cell wall biosynthesis